MRKRRGEKRMVCIHFGSPTLDQWWRTHSLASTPFISFSIHRQLQFACDDNAGYSYIYRKSVECQMFFLLHRLATFGSETRYVYNAGRNFVTSYDVFCGGGCNIDRPIYLGQDVWIGLLCGVKRDRDLMIRAFICKRWSVFSQRMLNGRFKG